MLPKDSIPEVSVLEMLEARIAPASVSGTMIYSPSAYQEEFTEAKSTFESPYLASPSEVRYTDADGDLVVVKLNKDVLDAAHWQDVFTFAEGERGMELKGIDLTALDLNPRDREKLSISVAVVDEIAFGPEGIGFVTSLNPDTTGFVQGFLVKSPYGDGLVNVGEIRAAGIDLGAVAIDGNLGRIIAGDSKLGTAGLESLAVESLGLLNGGLSDSTALMSIITGSLKKLNVAHDINGAVLWVSGGKKADLLDAHVGGDLVGGDFDYSGSIYVDGTIKKMVLDGDIVGGSDIRAGLIHAENGIKSLTIGGDIVGGSAYGAGRVEGVGGVGTIDVRGGVHAGTDEYAGSIYSTKSIKSVTVGENLQGGDDRGSGAIFADTKIGSAVVHGDLKGGAGEGSGYLQAQKSISKLTVDGDLVGGAGLRSGSVATFDGKIGKIDHDGEAVAGAGILSGKVIDFVNKWVKKSQSSGSTSGLVDFNGGTYSVSDMSSTSGVTVINATGGTITSTLPGVDIYTTGGVSGSSVTTSGFVKTGEGTLTLAGFDYVGGTVDFQELVMTTNVPLNTDTLITSFITGLGWPEDVVGAKLKRG